ncbi:hypothetical protein FOC84_07190 [Achromobacter pestifer]|uniref:EAL domain-containing protein n=1 Tax=Achromobacter pestifer TaxID=1353889 RepID=A0A7D4IJI0_9BURK|nr:hypothetical protein [Achromobacter pestifer]QKH34744.1 hypothetical protein FOC84_07190 [Achromobacter pestifer]
MHASRASAVAILADNAQACAKKMEPLTSGGVFPLPADPASAEVGYQPVFSADGRVCEYALPDLYPGHASRQDGGHPATQELHDALHLFGQGNQGIPLSFSYARDAASVPWSAHSLCAELNLSLERNRLHLLPGKSDDGATGPSYPASLVTLNIPMTWDLLPDAELFKNRHDFGTGLRVRIGPTLVEGRPVPHGVLRVAGLHMKIPERFSEHPMLHGKFFSLLQRAQAFKLPVLVMGIDDATDFHWMRSFPNLMFQGDLLSTRIGADSLSLLLAMGGDRWRDFKVGGHAR